MGAGKHLSGHPGRILQIPYMEWLKCDPFTPPVGVVIEIRRDPSEILPILSPLPDNPQAAQHTPHIFQVAQPQKLSTGGKPRCVRTRMLRRVFAAYVFGPNVLVLGLDPLRCQE